MASKGLTECWRDAWAAKLSNWRLMGVACGPREADPKISTAPRSGAPGRAVRTRSDWRAEAAGPGDALTAVTVKLKDLSK